MCFLAERDRMVGIAYLSIVDFFEFTNLPHLDVVASSLVLVVAFTDGVQGMGLKVAEPTVPFTEKVGAITVRGCAN